MINCTDFTFPSSDGVTSLHGGAWFDSDNAPRAVLQIAHGVSEHISRYDHFARFLVRHGFAVVGHDHLGHGDSLPEGGTPIYFADEDGWKHAVDDMALLQSRIRREAPDLPLFLLGHSMGSFLTRTFLIRYPRRVRGAVIMGTGWQSGLTIRGGLMVASAAALKGGKRRTSNLITNLAFGGYNKAFAPNRTAFDWLSADSENVDRYIADPQCGQDATIGLFEDMLGGIRFNQQPANLRRMDPDTPVLFISGGEDPVGAMGKGVLRSRDAFQKAGMKDVKCILYPGLRHEILNEQLQQSQVYADLLDWLISHL